MLGGGGHNKKGTRNDDFVACSKCGHRLTRKLVAEHYEIHKNGGKGYPKHPRNAYTKLYDELEDPKNKQSKLLAKSRLFIMYCNGSFDTTHRILQKHFNKLFKYKWQEYNTLVWIMFEREIFYDGIHDYLYLAEYFLSQGCPESMVESACSILSIILLFCAGLKIDMINAIFIIRYYLGGDEFGFGYQFVDEVTKEYLSCNRGPITSSRSKYPIGKVFERIQKGTGIETSLVSGIETALAAMNCERRAFSDHESDHESDDDVIMNTRFMDANDVTLGFD
eukprot:148703_1